MCFVCAFYFARRAETRKTKNVSANQFGDKLGRIHLGRQDLSSMKVSRVVWYRIASIGVCARAAHARLTESTVPGSRLLVSSSLYVLQYIG